MACAYLLTLNVAPTEPQLAQRSLTAKERAKTAAERVMDAMPADEAASEVVSAPDVPQCSLHLRSRARRCAPRRAQE